MNHICDRFLIAGMEMKNLFDEIVEIWKMSRVCDGIMGCQYGEDELDL